MKQCPEYRVRIFLSVDLVGSTAYKARSAGLKKQTQQPEWVERLKRFYLDFPDVLSKHFNRIYLFQKTILSDSCRCPLIWKTVGDEILFCCRVYSAQHAAVCVRSFLDALEEYGSYLERDTGGALDVKGSGWLAAFPAPNITISLPNRKNNTEEGDEAFEAEADNEPSSFDFLGQNIDAGFRTCRNAAGDHFSLSVELAYVLTKYVDNTHQFPFTYHGREIFKGVINNRPYPVVTVLTERKHNRIYVRNKERMLTNEPALDSNSLADFLEAFMDDEGVERPQLPAHANDQAVLQKAGAYKLYEQMWADDKEEEAQREKLLSEAETKSDGDISVIPDEIEEAATQIIAAAPGTEGTAS